MRNTFHGVPDRAFEMGLPAYTPEQQRKGQSIIIVEGALLRTTESLIGGVILAAFALALGANDVEIGIVAAIPFLAHLMHLPAVSLLAGTRDRRRFATRATFASRIILFAIAAIPLLTLPLRPIHALIPLLVVYASFANLAASAWQVWVRDLVPRSEIGAYFGKRLAAMSVVGLVVTLAAGQFVTYWSARYPDNAMAAFAILFALGGIAGLASVVALSRVPMIHATLVTTDLRAALREPMMDPNYRRVLVFLSAWGFAANLSFPFVSVVLLRTLGYSLGVVVAFAALSQAANAVSLRLWAPVTDRFGNKPVLGLSASVFVATMLAWALVPKTPGLMILIAALVVHVLLGLATAGLDLASNGIMMKLAPDHSVPAYLATASVAKSLAAGAAPLIGGVIALLLVDQAFSMSFAWTNTAGENIVTALRFAHYDFLFLLSAVLGLYAIHRLLGFQEEGEAPPDQVVRAMRRDIGQFSSIAGMRQFAHMASYVVEAAYRFERTFKRSSEEKGDEEKRRRE